MPINRRHFLQTTLVMGAGACIARSLGAAEIKPRASVTDFSADSTGNVDATAAVRKAIASLSKTNARLVFPAGKYTFDASSEVAMLFDGFDGIEIYANNSELNFAGGTTAFAFAGCHNVALHDMKLDWSGSEALTEKASGDEMLSHSLNATRSCSKVFTVQRAPGDWLR